MFNSKELKIVLSAVDNASKEINKVNSSLETIGSFAKKAAVAIGVAAGGFGYVLKQTTDASNELNNALIGLNSVSNAFKQDADKAKKAAVELASDGLMSVKSAADSLKNLLATGFSLPEAINLMKGFKDAAAFNRQGTLEFGQAIEGATQGIKNQNSILVDNAGITKNLSIILKEQGYSIMDLQNVTSDAGVRQALYNGILKEASIFSGDAARAASTLSGEQAALKTQIFNVKAAIGDQLAPVMLEFVRISRSALTEVSQFVEVVRNAGGIVVYMNDKISALMNYIEAKTGIITMLKTAWDDVALVFRNSLQPELQKLWEQLQPLMPFIETFAKVIGLILYGAIIAAVKALEVLIIVITVGLTKAIENVNLWIQKFKEYWDSLTSAISTVINYVDTLIEKIQKLNIVKSASNAIGSVLGFGGGRAIGGPVSSGTSYLVGERGPELFVPSSGGSIIPNNKMGGLTINIIGNTLLDNRAAEKIGDMIVNKLGMTTKYAY
jgi:hypothetical protein